MKRFVVWNGIEGLFLARLGGFRQWTSDANEALLIPDESAAKEIAENVHKISGLPVIVETRTITQTDIVTAMEAAKKDLADYCSLGAMLSEINAECALTRALIAKERALVDLVLAGINTDLVLLANDLAESFQA